MYLKTLEVNGFKSFANRTKLDFERGMTAIVGPNGCGKSNVSDAIRWVLGEKSAKALRGQKMQDVIFNGTDSHKPMGMAEVSLTLGDCENALSTEYNEVTVTRRVMRSGESQYLLNKAPCRLKDIQRLFMDTGIGTTSYSMMEQGRIDQILSSRPEDRRAVFEEASGITKFKADKKEALRKLDHTEANLLRLDDIIREVRRQIISLQRQAGKARRYKTMQDQLRTYELFFTKDRIGEFDKDLQLLEAKLAKLTEQDEAVRADLQRMEQENTKSRTDVQDLEQKISDAMEASAYARNNWERANELIRVNQDRMVEMKTMTERDSRDAEEAHARMATHREKLATTETEVEQATKLRDAVDAELQVEAKRSNEQDALVESISQMVHELRSELVELESRVAKTQNELAELEAQERSTVVRRERLTAEKADMQRAVDEFGERRQEMSQRHQGFEQEAVAAQQRLDELLRNRDQADEQVAGLQSDLSALQSRSAAKNAQIELLERSETDSEGFPGGAKLLLDPQSAISFDRRKILGTLAERLQPAENYRVAFEVVMRAWLDALILENDQDASALLSELQERGEGSARVLSVTTQAKPWMPSAKPVGECLLDHVTCDPAVRPLAERLLQRVFVVDHVKAISAEIEWDVTLVTRDGCLRQGDGRIEYWMPGDQETNPVARQQMLRQWRDELTSLRADEERLREQIADAKSTEATQKETLLALRETCRQTQERVAEARGELQIVDQEAAQAGQRLSTVSFELSALVEQDSSSTQRREEIIAAIQQVRDRQSKVRTTIADQTNQLRKAEQDRSSLNAKVTELRVRFVERRQRVETLATQRESLLARVNELDMLIRDREAGLTSYQSKIQQLNDQAEEAKQQLDPLQGESERLQVELAQLRTLRQQKIGEQGELEQVVRQKRDELEQVRTSRSSLDVEKAEIKIRRQTMIERVTSEYHITPEELQDVPEPEWEDGQQPDVDTIETTVGELRAKLESMGPVNLVAIDEHRELEERYAFLTQQQDDLVNAKQQLLEMIRKINNTTTELFTDTFNRVNENFQEMFKRLFGGGTAKLVLVDDEDVLESGIEIIARPPGKKLQSVSLLSGGERTMTAVGLLFSIYMVKPSPFCVLDELDAALDEANIGRFVDVVKGFVERSQFIIITHSRKTIGAADILYGVTMEQRGVSKIVSVKFSEYETKDQPSATVAAIEADVT